MSAEPKAFLQGEVIGVQPRIRLTRSFDQRDHSYLGYLLRVRGSLDNVPGEFVLGIGAAAQERHSFRVGDRVQAQCLPAEDPRREPAEYYKASKLEATQRGDMDLSEGPPWTGLPPTLEQYRARGHRRLAVQTYKKSCVRCMWGCRMAVDLILDHWKPSVRRYRFETFCYGPKSCPRYRAGPTRKVPGRRGMSWEEEDWVDEQATAHRAPDE